MEIKPQENVKGKDGSNVYQFPLSQRVKDGIIIPPEFKKRQAQDYLTVINDEIASAIIATLAANGVDISSERFTADFSMVTCLLEAAIYRTEDLEHPMSELLDVVTTEEQEQQEDEQ